MNVIEYHAITISIVKTNKVTSRMMARKRKAGGGRKPKGPIRSKSEVFTTRITPSTRAAIEDEAERSGQSISQVAERLLVLGMETRRRRQNNRSLRALCFLIEGLALRIGGAQWHDVHQFDDPHRRKGVESMQEEWRTDPFRYKAFMIAVQSLLNALKPEGEIRPPFSPELLEEAAATAPFGDITPAFVALMKNNYASPDHLAAFHVSNLWVQLNRDHPLSDSELEVYRKGGWVSEMMQEEFYGLQDARIDLGLGSQSKEDDE